MFVLRQIALGLGFLASLAFGLWVTIAGGLAAVTMLFYGMRHMGIVRSRDAFLTLPEALAVFIIAVLGLCCAGAVAWLCAKRLELKVLRAIGASIFGGVVAFFIYLQLTNSFGLEARVLLGCGTILAVGLVLGCLRAEAPTRSKFT